MRFVILNTDYPPFLEDLYERHPGLEEATYEEQLAVRNASMFGTADFYSRNLIELGHEAVDIHVNNRHLQHAWTREHGVDIPEPSRWPRLRLRGGLLPWLNWSDEDRWLLPVLHAQIAHYSPDVLLNHSIQLIDPKTVAAVRRPDMLVIAQHAASSLPSGFDVGPYDLAVSSWPPTLRWFQQRGVPAEPLRLGFDPVAVRGLDLSTRPFPLTFVGSLGSIHSSRIVLLERLAEEFPQLAIWSPDSNRLSPSSPLRDRVRGVRWGRGMYELLTSSRITINHHGDVGPHANNMRLYEATGAGAALVTDLKPDLRDLFEVGEEVAAYHDADHAVDIVENLLEDDDHRRQLAEGGRARTLAEHTYQERMRELLTIVGRYKA